AMGEDVGRRFEAYGWHVQYVDGHDHEAIRAGLYLAKKQTMRPALIVAKTVIGKGAPTKAGTHEVHGAPLGKTELAEMRRRFSWPEDTFHVPDDVRDVWRERAVEGQRERERWEEMLAAWRKAFPHLAALWDAHQARRLFHASATELIGPLVAAAGTKS